MSEKRELGALPCEGDALLLVPPFASLNVACPAVHALQACAREAGFRVSVFYSNFLFAARIGESAYSLAFSLPGQLPGESLFAAAAYGKRTARAASARDARVTTPFLPERATEMVARGVDAALGKMLEEQPRLGPREGERIERAAVEWADEVAAVVRRLSYPVVGCTTMFDQTAAAVALLDRVKFARPDILTVVGGVNCQGDLAEGIVSLGARIDYVFSGESEATFVEFLRAVRRGDLPSGPIVRGKECLDLDGLPVPEFGEFFDQRARWLAGSITPEESLEVPYETSRGCWWAERRGCHFCLQSGRRAPYRQKSTTKVVQDLEAILGAQRTRRVFLVDDVLRTEELAGLMQSLGTRVPSLDLFCEVRPTLSLREVLSLREGGVTRVQPGIEALSTPMLRRMGKGTSVRTNVAFLRYAQACGIRLYWNLLWGFPADECLDYEDALALIPLIPHLQPPKSCRPLMITRFSRYFEHPEEYGVRNVRPWSGFGRALPERADVWKSTWNFVGDFECASFTRPDLIKRLHGAFREWQSYWQLDILRAYGRVPELSVERESSDRYRLLDTRGLPGTQPVSHLDRIRAGYCLVARPSETTPEAAWALDFGVAVSRDGWIVPLAIAQPELLLEFEDEIASRSAQSGERGKRPPPGVRNEGCA